jgi:hypothetical protein
MLQYKIIKDNVNDPYFVETILHYESHRDTSRIKTLTEETKAQLFPIIQESDFINYFG